MGDLALEREILNKRVEGIRELVTALPTLDDPHIEFSLLRSCFAFALRSTDTMAHREVREEFDTLVRAGTAGGDPGPRTLLTPSGSRPPCQWPSVGSA